MRHLLFLFLLFSALTSVCQINITVSPADTTLCYRDSLAFTTNISGLRPYYYQWQRNGINITDAIDSVLIFPNADITDTGVYRCIVSNGIDSDTSNPAYLRMHPKMKFDTLYRYNDLGCPGVCKGQFKALISGGISPFDYHWGGGHSQDTIVFGLCPGRYRLIVTDSNGCSIDSSYFVDVLKAPKIDFSILPNDTLVYLTNPNIIVSVPDSLTPLMVTWEWDFGDEIKVPKVNPVSHTYAKTGTFQIFLTFIDLNGCDTAILHEMKVKTINLGIPNVITPNGDNKNDKFEIREITGKNSDGKNIYQKIDLLEVYLSNELVIVDRWGKKVFGQTNYNSGDWDGGNLAEGVYYYVFKGIGQYGNDIFHGSVTILRGSSSSP